MERGVAEAMVRTPNARPKAAIVVLARNQDVEGVLMSMTRLERRFNAKFNYPYVFLNDGLFDEAFKNRHAMNLLSQQESRACDYIYVEPSNRVLALPIG